VSTWRDSELFDEPERAALTLAEAMSATLAEMTDAVFDALRAHFTDAQIVELAASFAMENYRARFNRTFGVESIHTYGP
jgi:alkylhydroperoxidase family enzyme